MNVHNLKKSREAAHLTQAQVAEKLDITSVAYQNYEYGKREPNNSLLCKIADLFNVTTDYLLGRDSELEPFEVLAARYNLSEIDIALIMAFVALPKDERNALTKLLNNAGFHAEFYRDKNGD